MRFTTLLLPITALFTLAIGPNTQAQAPSTITGTVITFNTDTPMNDHRDIVYKRWLKTDGSFVDISRRAFRSGLDLGYLPPLVGRYIYNRVSASGGQLTFTPATGTSLTFNLTFADPGAGDLKDSVNFLVNGSGKFALRPAQTSDGPVNLSTRTLLTKAGATIAGFVIEGSDRRFVLLRAIGPGMKGFGVPGVADKMGLSAYNSVRPIAQAENWAAPPFGVATFQNLFALAGAFPLSPEDEDACLLLELEPGAYSAEMTAAVDGNALLEIYFLP